MPAVDPAWIALIGTLCGGLGLKVVEHWLGRSKSRNDDASQIRNELRTEIANLRQEVKELEDERDKYRDQYYELRDKYAQVYAELQSALVGIKTQAENTQATAETLNKQLPPPID